MRNKFSLPDELWQALLQNDGKLDFEYQGKLLSLTITGHIEITQQDFHESKNSYEYFDEVDKTNPSLPSIEPGVDFFGSDSMVDVDVPSSAELTIGTIIEQDPASIELLATNLKNTSGFVPFQPSEEHQQEQQLTQKQTSPMSTAFLMESDPDLQKGGFDTVEVAGFTDEDTSESYELDSYSSETLYEVHETANYDSTEIPIVNESGLKVSDTEEPVEDDFSKLTTQPFGVVPEPVERVSLQPDFPLVVESPQENLHVDSPETSPTPTRRALGALPSQTNIPKTTNLGLAPTPAVENFEELLPMKQEETSPMPVFPEEDLSEENEDD